MTEGMKVQTATGDAATILTLQEGEAKVILHRNGEIEYWPVSYLDPAGG